jgi:outer membrane protein OmpA-like peptidoglycan-associated protein
MEGYRLTVRGKVLLGLILALIASGLFYLGSTFSQEVVTVVNNQVDQVTPSASSTEGSTQTTEAPTVDVTTEGTTDGHADTTTGKTDNCNLDSFPTEAQEVGSPQDLIKTATIIYFKPDRYLLDDQSLAELKPFIKTALAYKDMPIIIEGHAGASSVITEDDETLAKKRAESIQIYLISQKITPSRIIITSLVGTPDAAKAQQDIWKTMRAEIYFQGYALEK